MAQLKRASAAWRFPATKPQKVTGFAVLATIVYVVMSCCRVADGLFNNLMRKRSNVDEYNLLNSLLVELVPEEEALPNILEAVRLLRMSKGEIPMEPDLELPSTGALVLFTDLLVLMDPERPQCDMEATEILSQNELATGSVVLMPENERPPQRRLESVIYEVALAHAKQCRYDYPIQLGEALAKESKKLRRDVERMMKSLITTSQVRVFQPYDWKLDPKQVAVRKASGVTVTGKAEAVALLQDVRDRARNDRDRRFLTVKPDPIKKGNWLVDGPKVVRLMDRYVYSRCAFLFRSFEHILQPAEFDQQLYSRAYKYRAISEETAQLMMWLEYYRLCKELMSKTDEVNLNVIEAIWDELKKVASK